MSKDQQEIVWMFDLIQQTKKSHSFKNFFGYENSIDEKLIIDVEPAIWTSEGGFWIEEYPVSFVQQKVSNNCKKRG